jgi:hypothetical protein
MLLNKILYTYIHTHIYIHTYIHTYIYIRGCIQKFPDWVDNEITTNTCWEAIQRIMAAKLTRLTHKTAIQLHMVAESCTVFSSRSRRPVRKLLDIYILQKQKLSVSELEHSAPLVSSPQSVFLISILMFSFHVLLFLNVIEFQGAFLPKFCTPFLSPHPSYMSRTS